MVIRVLILAALSVCTVMVYQPSVAAQEMQYPLAVVAAPEGMLYVADRNLPGIWSIKEGKLASYFEGSKKFRTPLNAVRCVAVDKSGRLLAGDSSTREVYRFDDAMKPTPLTAGGIGIPMSIAVDSSGDLFVADLELHYIWKVPQTGGQPVKFAEVAAPRGLFMDGQDRLWVVSHGMDQLLRFTADGKSEAVVKGRPFEFPHNVVVTPDNIAYVSDGYAKTIWRIAEGKEPVALIKGDPLKNPVGLSHLGQAIIVADPHARSVFTIDVEGKVSSILAK